MSKASTASVMQGFPLNRSQRLRWQTKAKKPRIENAQKKTDAGQKRVQARIRHKAEASNAKSKSTQMFRARSIQYEVSDRIQAIGFRGIGLIHAQARQRELLPNGSSCPDGSDPQFRPLKNYWRLNWIEIGRHQRPGPYRSASDFE